jgi:DNA-binding CsgD family transcriptional regulator
MAPMVRGEDRAGNPRKLGFHRIAMWSTLVVMGMRERDRRRVRERLETLVDAGLGAEEARYAAIAALRRVVGFERWCWPLTDPGSTLSTSGIGELDFWAALPRLAALEEHGDVTSKPHIALGPRASVALSAATQGDLASSPRWRECLQPYGIGDELMTVCRDRHGCWGSVELMRDNGDAPFNEADADLLHELAPILGTLIRRGVLQSWQAAQDDSLSLPPATLILDTGLHPSSWTPAFQDWLAELPRAGEMLPPAVYELGTRVLTPPRLATGLPARVRIRTRSGRWAVIEGAPLEGADQGRVAITVRSATGDEIFDLLCKTYDLSRRERQLVALVLDGLATKQLAEALCISPYTVQDHLKTIFAKTRVRSRGELISHLVGRIPNTTPTIS